MTPFQCFRNIPCHQSCFYARRLFADRKYLPEYRIRADYEHFLRCVLKQKEEAVYLPFTVAAYEGAAIRRVRKTAKGTKKSTG